ncbi:type IX secretion system outer membrane channel protein PorV [Dyadobacter sp. 676]|uniref:Type IX secretion system outer membrane channel protein PorV n=1 Tax=Dyadobacter sp. 676 TaxID=3088362 RepID=A0AAU8FR28_9BACT
MPKLRGESPQPAVSSLSLAPDARAAGMGFTGAATSADANAIYWNPGKLADADRDLGVSATYARWLPSVKNSTWTGFLSGYKKLGNRQVVGASVHYFNKSENDNIPTPAPGNDIIISGAYSRQLGRHFSMGATLKYISSNVGRTAVIGGNILETAHMVAGDIGAYYKSQPHDPERIDHLVWTAAATLTNIGPKVDYGSGGSYFLPTTLRVGGGLSYTVEGHHKLNVAADAGKLLVPTPVPGRNANQKPYFEGVLQSFSDAPGGFREEMREITITMGAEYWYKERYALRCGYQAENKEKGDRKIFTAGAGARFLTHYGIDFAYLFPVDKGSPLRNAYQVSGAVYF